MTARVFLRSSMAHPPVAVRASGSTITDADGRTYLDAAGGAIVVNVGHGRESVARVMAEQAGQRGLCPRLGVHLGAAGALGACPGTDPAHGRRRDLPRLGWLGGGRDGAQDGPRLSRRHVARPTAGWSSGAGARITATPWVRWTCRVADHCGGRTRRGWGGFGHVSAAYPYRAGDPGAHGPGHGRRGGRGAGADAGGGRAGTGGRVHRGTHRGCDAGGGRASGRLLGGDRRACCGGMACCSSRTRS